MVLFFTVSLPRFPVIFSPTAFILFPVNSKPAEKRKNKRHFLETP
jgi:hypothetical protein